MKLKIGDKVYLQEYEIAFILKELNFIPCRIILEMFDNGDHISLTNNNDPTRLYRFGHVYANPANVKWLMEQDWIIDYDDCAGMSLAELENLRNTLITEHFASTSKFNRENYTYREMHFDEENEKMNKIKHKIFSLKQYIDFRKCRIDFIFPGGSQDKTSSPDTPITTDIRPYSNTF